MQSRCGSIKTFPLPLLPVCFLSPTITSFTFICTRFSMSRINLDRHRPFRKLNEYACRRMDHLMDRCEHKSRQECQPDPVPNEIDPTLDYHLPIVRFEPRVRARTVLTDFKAIHSPSPLSPPGADTGDNLSISKASVLIFNTHLVDRTNELEMLATIAHLYPVEYERKINIPKDRDQ
ncbi:hypothetical protein IWX50DRAFT_371065 [Phyllosticta citricarpa]